ncbi:MAG: aegerolysin family protein [Collimonas sp.]|uniref:aegerolysin family protein n=1 Tax=Collimonas sp. TaxID=1963772 RepID=UPI003265C85F
MNTTVAASELSAEEIKVAYERLQVQGTVSNFTQLPMIIKSSNLSWGKWMQSPVDVPSFSNSRFASQGRDSSPSGTEGTATWHIGNAIITIHFGCPLNGSNSQRISCEPPGAFKVTCDGTGGDVNACSFQIKS